MKLGAWSRGRGAAADRCTCRNQGSLRPTANVKNPRRRCCTAGELRPTWSIPGAGVALALQLNIAELQLAQLTDAEIRGPCAQRGLAKWQREIAPMHSHAKLTYQSRPKQRASPYKRRLSGACCQLCSTRLCFRSFLSHALPTFQTTLVQLQPSVTVLQPVFQWHCFNFISDIATYGCRSSPEVRLALQPAITRADATSSFLAEVINLRSCNISHDLTFWSFWIVLHNCMGQV